MPPPPPPGPGPGAYSPGPTGQVESKKILAGVLGILLGGLGVHKFVLGYTKEGLLQILITVVTCGIGSIIGTGVFALPSALAPYGPISLVAFVVVTLGALALALTFGALSRRMPASGGWVASQRDANSWATMPTATRNPSQGQATSR